MIKKWFVLLLGGIVSLPCAPIAQSQNNAPTGMIENATFDQKAHDLLQFSVPTLSVEEVYEQYEEYTFVDTRQREEFEVSLIPGAIFLGYRDPVWSAVEHMPKDEPLVLYCSVGYRSEKMAEELRDRGFEKVYNLYGSIFEWANRGYPIETLAGDKTDTLHTYNRKWSQYVQNPEIEKTW